MTWLMGQFFFVELNWIFCKRAKKGNRTEQKELTTTQIWVMEKSEWVVKKKKKKKKKKIDR